MTAPGIPVIAIDGPSASGKGTVAALVAQALGFHYLDSGAIYRVTAHAAQRAGLSLDDEAALAELARGLDLRFEGGEVFLDGEAVGDAIRTEEAGPRRLEDRRHAGAARRPAGAPAGLSPGPRPGDRRTRHGLGGIPGRHRQNLPHGEPRGTRAQRRYKQLIEKGFDANLAALFQDLSERDARDAARAAAPLKQTADAALLDTTGLTISQAVERVLQGYRTASAA
jgi:cytidylate kinase